MKKTRSSTTASARSEARPGPRLVLFTDLDGTLLDEQGRVPEAAARLLAACPERGVLVVPVTSKTRAELEGLGDRLGIRGPFATENGGGVYVPRDLWPRPAGFHEAGPYWRRASGLGHAAVLAILAEEARACGVGVEPLSGMQADAAARCTGLDGPALVRCRTREFDEPFLAPGAGPEALARLEHALRRRGLRLSRGGRFHHAHGPFDKGTAVRTIMALFRDGAEPPASAAVGDAPNDRPMLEAVRRAFLVRRGDGTADPRARPPAATVTRGAGPDGWVEAVEALLSALDTARAMP